MRACPHPWGIYIQADEVLHEAAPTELAAAVREHDGDPRVEGLLVRYLHFYGGFQTIATHRRWYRREVRAVRLDPALDIRPYQGAQGFRVGPEHRTHPGPPDRRPDVPLRLGPTRAGAAGEAGAGEVMYPWRNAASGCRCWPGFRGSTPSGRTSRGRARLDRAPPGGPRTGDRAAPVPRHRSPLLRVGLIERLTGVRVFEFRNYTIV